MKSTQDLAMFIKELSELRKVECVLTIYPDKSFVIAEYTAASNTIENIYESSDDSAAYDINDLVYLDVANFQQYLEELSSIKDIAELDTDSYFPDNSLLGSGKGKFDNI